MNRIKDTVSIESKALKKERTAKIATQTLIPLAFILLGILIWQVICWSGKVEPFILPSPADVLKTFFKNFKLLMNHYRYTFFEAMAGLALGTAIGFILALIMDRFKSINLGFKPLLVISQTIPTVAIAPIIVLWFGLGMASKIILVTLTTFFPIAIGLLDGYKNVDDDQVNLLRSMGANKFQIYRFLKFPASLNNFFSAMKISTTYSIIAAVVAEWIGGFSGVGVYMMRVRKAYAYANMFAAILLISISSLILIGILDLCIKIINRNRGKYEK